MHRANKILSHLGNNQAQSITKNNTSGSDDDIVIIQALRTAIGRSRKGSFKDTHPVALLAPVLKAVCEKSGLKQELVNDITVGNVLTPGAFATQARMATFMAGFPETTALHTVNRQCSSGLQACANVASSIASGFYDIGIAAGVESMSTASMGNSVGEIYDGCFTNPGAKSCLIPMGITSETVAERYGVSRADQDAMAAHSHLKALAAIKEGRFVSEIVPISTTVKSKEGEEKSITVAQDDGPRAGTTVEKLAKLRAVFKKGGSTTAGNASQTSDGAAAVLMMKRSKAKELGLTVMGTFKQFSVVGVKPDEMGIGPAAAIPAVLKKVGMSVNDIDVYEINEAFASQAHYCVTKLGIDMAKVNPNGGAIALGHPLGCTGARQVATLMAELKRQGKTNGVVSMCIGTGMGAAAVLTRE